jgi:hypothetical protein
MGQALANLEGAVLHKHKDLEIPKKEFPIKIFAKIFKYSNVHEFLSIVSASKELRKKYLLNSEFVMKYIDFRLSLLAGIRWDNSYGKLYNLHHNKMAMEASICSTNNMIKISGTGKTNMWRGFPAIFSRSTVYDFDVINIVGGLLKEKYNGCLILIPVDGDKDPIELPFTKIKHEYPFSMPKGKYELWFKFYF